MIVESWLNDRAEPGTRGTIEWMQELPTQLSFKPLGAPAEIRTPNGPGTLPLARRSSRIVAGHPEGFHEGFANIYSYVDFYATYMQEIVDLLRGDGRTRRPASPACEPPGEQEADHVHQPVPAHRQRAEFDSHGIEIGEYHRRRV